MQTAMIRIYDDATCRNPEIDVPIPRVEAMEQILAGFRAATEIEISCHNADKEVWNRSRWLRWAGYDPCETAAPLGQQHFTRVQLYRAVGSYIYEYVLPGGLTPTECDDLCRNVVGEDDDTDQKQDLLVTSTLASVLHADGVSLEYHVVDFACGRATVIDEPFRYECDGANHIVLEPITIVPASLPTTLSTAVRDRGWSATVKWLRETHAALAQVSDKVREDRAVWMSASEPKPPWEPLILRPLDGGGCLRLALGAEAAVKSGVETNEYISLSEAANMASIRPQNVGRQAAKKGLLKYVGDHPVIERKGWCELRKIDPTKPVRRQHRIEKPKPTRTRDDLDDENDSLIAELFGKHGRNHISVLYIHETVQSKYKDVSEMDVCRVLQAGRKRGDYGVDADGNWFAR